MSGLEPAVVAAIIGGGTALGSSALNARSSGKASKSELAANDQALAFQREESAKEEARYKQAKAEQAMAWNDYNRTMEPRRRRHAQLLGIDYVAPASVAPEGWAPPGAESTLGSMARDSSIPAPIEPTAALYAPTLGDAAAGLPAMSHGFPPASSKYGRRTLGTMAFGSRR